MRSWSMRVSSNTATGTTRPSTTIHSTWSTSDVYGDPSTPLRQMRYAIVRSSLSSRWWALEPVAVRFTLLVAPQSRAGDVEIVLIAYRVEMQEPRISRLRHANAREPKAHRLAQHDVCLFVGHG